MLLAPEVYISSSSSQWMVAATYDLGEGMKGTIGIIGPKRMDYDKVVDNLKGVMSQLDSIYKKK